MYRVISFHEKTILAALLFTLKMKGETWKGAPLKNEKL